MTRRFFRSVATEHLCVAQQAEGSAHELECKIADLSVQLERALSKHATLEGRIHLLEQFVGLHDKLTSQVRLYTLLDREGFTVERHPMQDDYLQACAWGWACSDLQAASAGFLPTALPTSRTASDTSLDIPNSRPKSFPTVCCFGCRSRPRRSTRRCGGWTL